MLFAPWLILTSAGALVASLETPALDAVSRLQAETTLPEEVDCEDEHPAPIMVKPVKPVLRFETKVRPVPVVKVETKTAPVPVKVPVVRVPQAKTAELPKLVKKPTQVKTAQPAPVEPETETSEKEPSWGQMKKELLDVHNLVRAAHGLPLLHWSTTLEDYAQKWSDKCIYEHSNGPDYGENIALGYYGKDIRYAVKAFYDELKTFDWSHGAFDEEHGHVSQMLWDDTTHLGCAITKCPSLNNQGLLFCEYNPPGNVINNAVDPTPEESKEFRSHMRKKLPGATLPAWLIAPNP